MVRQDAREDGVRVVLVDLEAPDQELEGLVRRAVQEVRREELQEAAEGAVDLCSRLRRL